MMLTRDHPNTVVIILNTLVITQHFSNHHNTVVITLNTLLIIQHFSDHHNTVVITLNTLVIILNTLAIGAHAHVVLVNQTTT